MFTKKRIFFIILAVLFLSFLGYFGPGISDYLEYRGVAEAAGGMPWQDGGKITLVREPCILDTPATSPTTCAVSCPEVTAILASACVGYIELDVSGQLGTTFMAVPTAFQYKGGGTHPIAGTSFIAGGSSPAQPWVIGIPSAAASRTQKLVRTYEYIVALFKKD